MRPVQPPPAAARAIGASCLGSAAAAAAAAQCRHGVFLGPPTHARKVRRRRHRVRIVSVPAKCYPTGRMVHDVRAVRLPCVRRVRAVVTSAVFF